MFSSNCYGRVRGGGKGGGKVTVLGLGLGLAQEGLVSPQLHLQLTLLLLQPRHSLLGLAELFLKVLK